MTRKLKAKAGSRTQVRELTEVLNNNYLAQKEGPAKKHWSIHDMRVIKPLTVAQNDMFHAYLNGYTIAAYGSAGSGKSFLAMYLAFLDVFKTDNDYHKIMIIRSIVPTREMGFLPGTETEKMTPYERPYKEIARKLFGRQSSYDDMKETGLIVFESTSYPRGVTWDNSIIIVDEAQCMTLHEIDSIMTRVGSTSRIIILGDTKQNDLVTKKTDVSGFKDFLTISEKIPDIAKVQFTYHDIVRSEFVKSWIIAKEESGF